jgi:hypothetical protein
MNINKINWPDYHINKLFIFTAVFFTAHVILAISRTLILDWCMLWYM